MFRAGILSDARREREGADESDVLELSADERRGSQRRASMADRWMSEKRSFFDHCYPTISAVLMPIGLNQFFSFTKCWRSCGMDAPRSAGISTCGVE